MNNNIDNNNIYDYRRNNYRRSRSRSRDRNYNNNNNNQYIN